MISWTPPTARTALNHERLKTGPFSIVQQTTDYRSFLKSYFETKPTRFGNPLYQHALDLHYALAASFTTFVTVPIDRRSAARE